MFEYYPAIRNIHFSLALVSISFFTLRAFWAIAESAHLKKKWVKIAPHVFDTLLLITAIILAILSHQYPFQQHWLTAKVLALCFYIVFGTMAIKHAKMKSSRLAFMLLALATFAYILSVAFTKKPVPFF